MRGWGWFREQRWHLGALVSYWAWEQGRVGRARASKALAVGAITRSTRRVCKRKRPTIARWSFVCKSSVILLCSRGWLFQAQAEARQSGMAFCNRFAPLEVEGDVKGELAQGEAHILKASEPRAAKQARWRKWRPPSRARACRRKLGPSAPESVGWDALTPPRGESPTGALASSSLTSLTRL